MIPFWQLCFVVFEQLDVEHNHGSVDLAAGGGVFRVYMRHRGRVPADYTQCCEEVWFSAMQGERMLYIASSRPTIQGHASASRESAMAVITTSSVVIWHLRKQGVRIPRLLNDSIVASLAPGSVRLRTLPLDGEVDGHCQQSSLQTSCYAINKPCAPAIPPDAQPQAKSKDETSRHLNEHCQNRQGVDLS